ncbi:MAG TPA: malonyl-CoA decarboxylase family protein, partial [Microthrixaceae bacterium]|nr:malonyl-CoA decarboxylase family protein [Microthrixaceae bacterium]
SSALGPRSGLPPESSRSDLLGACARYLTATDSDGRLIDSVARFHMRNGARLWRINWLGDISTRGLNRSWGLMANYRYSPEDREANKLALAQGRPALGAEVAEFLQESL